MQADLFNIATKAATLSDCRNYRYSLSRTWNPDGKKITFIGLNPSTADEYQDDPTIRRCIAFSQSWGGGSLWMINLFALRSTDPKSLYNALDPVGPDNDHHIRFVLESSDIIVAAWGNHGSHLSRDKEVLEIAGGELLALSITKAGMPGHPLYLPKNSLLTRYPRL